MPQLPARSAPHLVGGIILLAIGQAIWQAGQQAAIRAALDLSSYEADGSGVAVIGAVVSLMGFVAVVTGVHRLARGVDTLVVRAAMAEYSAGSDQVMER